MVDPCDVEHGVNSGKAAPQRTGIEHIAETRLDVALQRCIPTNQGADLLTGGQQMAEDRATDYSSGPGDSDGHEARVLTRLAATIREKAAKYPQAEAMVMITATHIAH